MAKKKDGKSKPSVKINATDRASERRVAVVRDKLAQAMEDPLMRDQIVRAIRTMMREEKS